MSPLHPGSSQKTVSENISEMRHSGHPESQAVAAALSNAQKTGDMVGKATEMPDPIGQGSYVAPRSALKIGDKK